jgi:hypothetical protein
VVKFGVVKLVPVPKLVPPVKVAYQFIVPALDVAPNVKVPGPQLKSGVVDVIVGIGRIVATTAALGEEVQPLFVAET